MSAFPDRSPDRQPHTDFTTAPGDRCSLEHPVLRRAPALPVAVGFAVGIAADRWLHSVCAWTFWLAAGLFLFGLWLAVFRTRRHRWSVGLLLAAVVCVGGARHHLFWSVGDADHISHYVGEERRLVRIIGTVTEQPWIRSRKGDNLRSAWPQLDKTLGTLRCRALRSEKGWLPVSGSARLSVTGHLLHVNVGDEVEVCGWLTRPRPPANPGGFDFRSYLRRQGVRCSLYTDYPEAVQRLEEGDGWWFSRKTAELRERCRFLFVQQLGRSRVPLASALLLGDRSHVSHNLRRDFAESGMMHILAISGLHVGILATLIWGLCRLLNLSAGATAGVLLLVIGGYVCLTQGRPPVLRAGTFIAVAALGLPWYRRAAPVNLLAVAALLVLSWNPSDLFDVGAQLSFLAVTAIFWAGTTRWGRPPMGLTAAGGIGAHGWGNRGWRFLSWLGGRVRQAFVVTASIWLFVVPLVAAEFHLVSPVGLVIHVLLLPLVFAVLWASYLFLICGLLFPWAAGPVAPCVDGGLWLLLKVVEKAADLRLAHVYLPGPPGWWLIGFYGLLGVVALLGPLRPTMRRWGVLAGAAWIAAGLGIAFVPQTSDGLRCTVLSLGHGSGILVETPSGRTLLYDAGSIRSGLRARQTVQGAMWAHGRPTIDALVISHSDLDHFNAVPGLLETVPVGSVGVARSVLQAGEDAMPAVFGTAREEGVAVSVIGRGDRILLDDEVSLTVLHPGFAQPPAQAEISDNAQSIVLQVDYAGRRILLPGDLEGPGLERLLADPPRDVDVLLAPHHGSVSANPPELAQWAQPEYVIVSGNRRQFRPERLDVYRPEARILSTARDGAVTVHVAAGGELRVRTRLESSPEEER